MVGCRVHAPIAVWKPPRIASAVGTRVAIAELTGPRETARAVREQMLATPPRDPGRAIVAIDPLSLPTANEIRLVSATEGESSDLAVTMAARKHGIDYILRGEVLEDRSRRSDASPRIADRDASADAVIGARPPDPIRLSWRLVDVRNQNSVGGDVVVVDLKSASERYPDLGLIGDPDTILVTAAARRSYELLTPSIERTEVPLATSYGVPGARKTRRGNRAAMSGRWGEAERLWSEVHQQYAGTNAATHNLAIAAVAAQDFNRAKRLIRDLHAPWSGELIEQSLLWIELRQRDYHQAFGLPDPVDGWQLTQPTPGTGVRGRATNYRPIPNATGPAALTRPDQ